MLSEIKIEKYRAAVMTENLKRPTLLPAFSWALGLCGRGHPLILWKQSLYTLGIPLRISDLRPLRARLKRMISVWLRLRTRSHFRNGWFSSNARFSTGFLCLFNVIVSTEWPSFGYHLCETPDWTDSEEPVWYRKTEYCFLKDAHI